MDLFISSMDGQGVKASRTQRSKKRLVAFRAIVAVTVTPIALAGTEMAARVVDGYRLGSLRPEAFHVPSRTPRSDHQKASQKWRNDGDAPPYVPHAPTA